MSLRLAQDHRAAIERAEKAEADCSELRKTLQLCREAANLDLEAKRSAEAEVARLRAALELVSWRQSAKVDPSQDGWIFGRWVMDNGRQEIHMVHWCDRSCHRQRGWNKLDDGILLRDPKWWMPIPPLEPK